MIFEYIISNNDIVIERAQSARGNPGKLSINAKTTLDHYSRAKALLRDEGACVVIANKSLIYVAIQESINKHKCDNSYGSPQSRLCLSFVMTVPALSLREHFNACGNPGQENYQ